MIIIIMNNSSLACKIVMALKCRGAYVMDGVYTTIDTSQIMAASRKVTFLYIIYTILWVQTKYYSINFVLSLN